MRDREPEREPLIRVMALHALAYCERLFYLEEVEEIRVADERVYEGRCLHEQIPEYSRIESLQLESESLGIYGKVDCVRRENGEWIPFEYKKGRARIGADGRATAWPSDELQIAAYAMLLEEHIGRPVSEGRIYYAADHRTVVIKIEENLRQQVLEAVERARQLRATTVRPEVTRNERLCTHCSLAPVCLPEEERLIRQPDKKIVRLFPENREALDLHIVTPGATVRKNGDTIVIEKREGENETIPIEQVGSITLHGFVQITTQLLHTCAHRGIHVHWMTAGGKYVGSLTQAAGGVQRRLRQYKGLTDESLKFYLAKRLVLAKVESQLRYILRQSRSTDLRNEIENKIEIIRKMIKNIYKSQQIEQLLGYEGMAGKAYFQCLASMLRNTEGAFRFQGRSRRPPKDPVNALLSFLYGLLYRACVQAIVTVGLDPTVGFYHQPRSAAYPLALDLMELFRVPLCDIPVIGSINRNQWKLEDDFVLTENKEHVWLSETGRKKAISLYEKRKQDKWKHPVIGYSLSYARMLELEVRLLEKEWSGHSGLFALNRLR